MKGNDFETLMEDLLTMGGPEKDFLFRGRRYFLEAQMYEPDPSLTEFILFECWGEQKTIFRCHGEDFRACVAQFEKAPVFEGLTIREAEPEIGVLFG